jgi:phage-related protein
MNQIKFGTYKSYDDLYLICTKKTIGSPTVKESTVEVEGGDGVLDYTEYFGDVKYNNRQLKFEFESLVPQSQFPELYSAVLDALHGKKVQIVLDEDSDFYYVGRLSVSDFTNNRGIGSIKVDCDCDPYKYKKNATTVSKAVSGSLEITLPNLRKRVVPTITSSATMTFAFGNRTIQHNAGIFIIPTLELVKGNNTVTVTGTGNVSFTYQEGRL